MERIHINKYFKKGKADYLLSLVIFGVDIEIFGWLVLRSMYVCLPWWPGLG